MLKNLFKNIKEKRPTILVVGDLMLDRFIFGSVDRISPEAPVPIVKFKKEEQMLGGCGNVIRNLDNLGVKTLPFSAIGEDLAGELLVKQLSKKEIPILNVLRLSNIKTTENAKRIRGGLPSIFNPNRFCFCCFINNEYL